MTPNLDYSKPKWERNNFRERICGTRAIFISIGIFTSCAIAKVLLCCLMLLLTPTYILHVPYLWRPIGRGLLILEHGIEAVVAWENDTLA